MIPSVKWVVEGFSDLICVQHNDCHFIVLQKQQLQRVPLSRHGRLDLIYGAPTLHQGLPEAARSKGTLHPQGSAPWSQGLSLQVSGGFRGKQTRTAGECCQPWFSPWPVE